MIAFQTFHKIQVHINVKKTNKHIIKSTNLFKKCDIDFYYGDGNKHFRMNLYNKLAIHSTAFACSAVKKTAYSKRNVTKYFFYFN